MRRAAPETATRLSVSRAPRPAPRFEVRAALPRFLAVVLYAVGMAYVEAAAVLYLRTLLGGVDPVGLREPPIEPSTRLFVVELGREAATMIMLASVGWLGGRGAAGRIGAFLAAFGVWDIFYYVFLRLFIGWPTSLLSPDILFLIPLPWWGPVLAPVLIALAMVAYGLLAMARELGDGIPAPDRLASLLVVAGALICLGAFMADALLALPRGLPAALAVTGEVFPWAVYLAGFGAGALGMARILTRPNVLSVPRRG